MMTRRVVNKSTLKVGRFFFEQINDLIGININTKIKITCTIRSNYELLIQIKHTLPCTSAQF